MIKRILNSIETILSTISGVRYIDIDWGQGDSERVAVKMPCALIDVKEINKDYRAVGIVQGRKCTVEIRVIDINTTNTSAGAPQGQKEVYYAYLDLVERIEGAVSGAEGNRFVFEGLNRVVREDHLREMVIRYSISWRE
jgi:hypothetical protein